MTRLQQLRMDANLTPEQLGEKTGTSGRTIRRIEGGKSTNLRTLNVLGDFFGVRATQLLEVVTSTTSASGEAA